MSEDQEKVAKMREEIGNKWPHVSVRDAWAFLVTEVGEVGDVLIRLGYSDAMYVRNSEYIVTNADLIAEIGDVYLMLCSLANNLGISLPDALDNRIRYLQEKYGHKEEPCQK